MLWMPALTVLVMVLFRVPQSEWWDGPVSQLGGLAAGAVLAFLAMISKKPEKIQKGGWVGEGGQGPNFFLQKPHPEVTPLREPPTGVGAGGPREGGGDPRPPRPHPPAGPPCFSPGFPPLGGSPGLLHPRGRTGLGWHILLFCSDQQM